MRFTATPRGDQDSNEDAKRKGHNTKRHHTPLGAVAIHELIMACIEDAEKAPYSSSLTRLWGFCRL
jgi:hypothetical protein